jgi:hypothetical protein
MVVWGPKPQQQIVVVWRPWPPQTNSGGLGPTTQNSAILQAKPQHKMLSRSQTTTHMWLGSNPLQKQDSSVSSYLKNLYLQENLKNEFLDDDEEDLLDRLF